MATILQLLEHYMRHAPTCLFHRLTGLYCPGCGGTRALYLFLRGQWAASFVYHPLVLYTFVTCIYLCIRFLLRRISNHFSDKNRSSYRPSAGWLWGALLLVIANFIVKNVALLVFHVDLLHTF